MCSCNWVGVNSVQLQKQILLQLTEGGHRTEISQSNLRISQFCMYLVDKKHSCVGYRTLGSAVLCRDGDKISRVSLPDLGFFPVWGRRSEYGGPSVICGEILLLRSFPALYGTAWISLCLSRNIGNLGAEFISRLDELTVALGSSD